MKYKDEWSFKIDEEINPDLQEQVFEEIKEQMEFFKTHVRKNARADVKDDLRIIFKFSIELVDFSEDEDATLTITEK